jgi:hypothetical protein
MEVVRYKPGEAIRWLETGAADSRKSAREKGRLMQIPSDADSLKGSMRAAAGALLDLGRSALTELAHAQATASEFALHDDHFEVIRSGSNKKILYKNVISMEQKGDRTTITMEQGHFAIRPYAYITAGRLKVPIGWARNGIEVPFHLLVEELAARSGVELS